VKAIDRRHPALIRATIEQQLTYEPHVESRNRKTLLREVEFEADWEIRFGPDNRFRVFYAIDLDRREVQILAIGVKSGNRLFIGNEEVKL
jgi:hypothetical protein